MFRILLDFITTVCVIAIGAIMADCLQTGLVKCFPVF